MFYSAPNWFRQHVNTLTEVASRTFGRLRWVIGRCPRRPAPMLVYSQVELLQPHIIAYSCVRLITHGKLVAVYE